MENSENVQSNQREFGYCIVNWSIKNFGFAAHGMEYEIKSEAFSVRPHMTNWRMALKSELGLCDDTEMTFCLERMADAGPDTVFVNMNLSLFDQDGKEWKVPSGLYCIRQCDSKVISVRNIYFGRVNVSLYNFYSMSLRCEMFVYEVTSKDYWKYGESVNYGLYCLSLDMEKLYRYAEYSDITLPFNFEESKKLTAHRAILSARSEIFKDLLSRGAGENIMCRCLDYEAVRSILKYMYTGEVRGVLEKPSYSIVDCITAFSLCELDEIYVADEIKLKSKIDIDQTGFMWKIENFSRRDEEFISSSVINSDVLQMAWQVRLYPRGIGGKDEYLTVVAENMEGKIEGDVWAKVEVYNGSHDRVWRTMEVVKEGELFELHNFESRNSVIEKLENDTLKLCFKVCASIRQTHSSSVQQVYPIPSIPCDFYTKKLSNDIFSLRGDTRFSDITVHSEGKEFKAHKCILSARSSKMRNLSDDLNEDKVICIDNVRSDILEIVLDYMYSGVFKTFQFDELLEVYSAAWNLEVYSLVSECFSVLRSSINEDNVLKLLKTAHNLSDKPLKEQCLKFLSVNVSTRDEILKKLESDSPDLSSEVKGHLKIKNINSLEGNTLELKLI